MKQLSIITPKTKIFDLINDYPELEELLFDISPAFRQLQNPVLRRTVARVTTLQQAALVGGIKVEDLVNRLRTAAGVKDQAVNETATQKLTSPGTSFPAPDWFSEGKIKQHLDARDMLNRGEHPVGQVLADLHNLAETDIYELIAPFYPAPLIDKASGIGFLNYVVGVNPEEYRVYFTRMQGQ